jgi:hypothetical protein
MSHIFRGKNFTMLIAIAATFLPGDAFTQPNFSNACGTRFGVCPVGWAPVGSGCGCGNDPGRIIWPPFSDACQTRYGICRIYPRQIGNGCACGADPGQVVAPPR